MGKMTKTLTVVAAVATIGVAAVAAPQPAQARGGALAAGIIGGLAAGAIVGSAVHGPYYGYGPGYYYGPGPVYYRDGPCYWCTRDFLAMAGAGSACGFATSGAKSAHRGAQISRKARELTKIPGFFEGGMNQVHQISDIF